MANTCKDSSENYMELSGGQFNQPLMYILEKNGSTQRSSLGVALRIQVLLNDHSLNLFFFIFCVELRKKQFA